jgi:hypothetical protein
MNSILRATNNLKPFLNQIVGYVRVNKSYIHHKNTFETAAWWEDSEIQTGIYPLVLKQSYLAPYSLILSSIFSAKVTDCHFGSSHDKNRIGGDREIHVNFDIVDCINKTGYISGEEKDFVVHPFLWEGFIESARIELEECVKGMNQSYQDYHFKGDGNYNGNLSMLGYYARNIEALTKAIDEMKRVKDKFDNATEYMAKIYSENTSWAA